MDVVHGWHDVPQQRHLTRLSLTRRGDRQGKGEVVVGKPDGRGRRGRHARLQDEVQALERLIWPCRISRSTGWRQDLQTAPATEHSGQKFLVRDRLRQTRSMLHTDQQFPSVSSQTKGLKVNDDGSVDVYFGPEAPGWRRDKLGANGSRQELEHLAAPLRAGESPRPAAVSELPLGAIVGPRCYRPASPVGAAF